MSINDAGSIVSRLCNLTSENIGALSVGVHMVSKARQTDSLFISKRESLDSDLHSWLKDNVLKNLKDLRIENENDNLVFLVEEYSHQIKKNDYIARINLDENEVLKQEKEKLINAIIRRSDFEDKGVKFQVIDLSFGGEHVYFVYYRGVKKSGVKRKHAKGRIPAIRNSEQLKINDHDVIEFGGKIEMFIVGNEMYVVNPMTLENTFEYKDHINISRDQNLQKIVNMSFFDEGSNTTTFIEKSNHVLLSRGLADISQSTLEVLEENFEQRCDDLRIIEEGIPEDENERQQYLKKYEPLWPLYDHIDLDDNVVRFNSEKSVTPLLHFFSDRIMESFLTKQFKA